MWVVSGLSVGSGLELLVSNSCYPGEKGLMSRERYFCFVFGFFGGL
jgi:hypothetical protein